MVMWNVVKNVGFSGQFKTIAHIIVICFICIKFAISVKGLLSRPVVYLNIIE